MESHGSQPEKGAGLEEKSVRRLHLDLFIFQQGTEEEDFERQSFHHASYGERTVCIVRLDPGKGLLLSRDRRDMKRNRSARPLQHPVDEAGDEKKNGRIRNNDGKQGIQAHPACSGNDEEEEHKNC